MGTYYENHKEDQKAYKKEYFKTHKESIKQQHKAYRESHKPLISKKKCKYDKDRKERDPAFRIITCLRSRTCRALKGNFKSGSAIRDLGCSIDFLKSYLEAKFLPGMTWKNHGRGHGNWNVDHIKPLASFDLTNPEQFKQACHYTNLQPLWAIDNIIKSDKT